MYSPLRSKAQAGLGKGIMVEEPMKMKKKDQISLDEELAFKLQAERRRRKACQRKSSKRRRSQHYMDTELVERHVKVRAEGSETRVKGSFKRAGEERKSGCLEQESSKKQKLEEDKETAELQRLIEVVPDKEEVAIDAIPLATKPPSIVDYKIHKEGKKTYYQIIRAVGIVQDVT
ncbi:hypothetical protein Tco_0664327 [Tanacetum coccineum]